MYQASPLEFAALMLKAHRQYDEGNSSECLDTLALATLVAGKDNKKHDRIADFVREKRLRV